MAISQDAVSKSSVGATVTSLTWSHTVGTGSNKKLSVSVQARDAGLSDMPITGITFNGVALTKVRADQYTLGGTDGGQLRTEVWELRNPTTTTANIVVTFTGTVNHASGHAVSLFGVDQSSASNASNGANAATSAPTVNVTSTVDNCWAVDSVYSKIGTDMTVGGGQTGISTQNGVNGGGDRAWASYEGPKTPAGAITMSYTHTGTDDYCITAVAYAPAGTAYTETYTEAIVIAPTLIKSEGRILSQVVTIVDTINKSTSRLLSDVVTVVDSVIKAPGRILSDVVTVVDSTVRSTGRVLTDVVTVVDDYTRIWTIGRVYSETLTLVDSIVKAPGRILSEVITLVDSLIRSTGRVLSEAIIIVDSLIRNTGRVLSEVVVIVDSIIRSMGRVLSDTLIFVDSVLKSSGRILTDTVVLIDSITKIPGKVLEEAIIIVDSFIKNLSKILSEILSIVENRIGSIGRLLSETIQIKDGSLPGINYNGTSSPQGYATMGNVLTSNTVVTASIRLRITAVPDTVYEVAFGYGNQRWFIIFQGINTRREVAFNVRAPTTEKSSGYIASGLVLNKEYTIVGFYDPNGGADNIGVEVYDEYSDLYGSSYNTITGALGTTVQPLQIAHDPARNFYIDMVGREARVWGRILTLTERQNLAKYIEPDETDLIGRWKCDEGSGSVIADDSGSGNNGALNGTYSWADFKRGIIVQVTRSLTEISSIVDTILNTKTYGRIYEESIILIDTLILIYGKVFTEQLTVRSIFRTFNEWFEKVVSGFKTNNPITWFNDATSSFRSKNDTNWYTDNESEWKD